MFGASPISREDWAVKQWLSLCGTYLPLIQAVAFFVHRGLVNVLGSMEQSKPSLFIHAQTLPPAY